MHAGGLRPPGPRARGLRGPLHPPPKRGQRAGFARRMAAPRASPQRPPFGNPPEAARPAAAVGNEGAHREDLSCRSWGEAPRPLRVRAESVSAGSTHGRSTTPVYDAIPPCVAPMRPMLGARRARCAAPPPQAGALLAARGHARGADQRAVSVRSRRAPRSQRRREADGVCSSRRGQGRRRGAQGAVGRKRCNGGRGPSVQGCAASTPGPT
jgi:hypothetical protein